MFVDQMERNMTSKLNEVMNQLNLALKREEEAENLLKEQTRQLEELNRRIDGAATERAAQGTSSHRHHKGDAWDFSGLGYFWAVFFSHKFCIKHQRTPKRPE